MYQCHELVMKNIRERLLTTREASHILGIPEKEIIDLSQSNLIPHFKVAGEFLRFKKKDIIDIRSTIRKKYNIPERNYRLIEKTKEYFYFNDFYVASTLAIILLLWVIIKDLISAV